MGGTAIGTGLNAHPQFGGAVAAKLASMTGLPFVTSHNYFAGLSSQDTAVELSGQLKTLVNEDPRHVILTANQTGMPFAVAATARNRYLGCQRLDAAAFDALRNFRTAYRR